MKKIIILLFALMTAGIVFAQDKPDVRLLDKVKAQVGKDTEQLVSSSATSGGNVRGTTYVVLPTKKGYMYMSGSTGRSTTLNSGVTYRFTIGNSEQSAGALTFRLRMSETKNEKEFLIKSMEVKSGDISSFDFPCTRTAIYNYDYSFDVEGKYQSATVISKVKSE